MRIGNGGGVPIHHEIYGLNEDYQAARNTFQETVAFIVANADSAAALLRCRTAAPTRSRDQGAPCAQARVLLYAARIVQREPERQAETGTPRYKIAPRSGGPLRTPRRP